MILIQGGLGNQLFQLCALLKFSIENGAQVVLDSNLVRGVTRKTTPRELEIQSLLNPNELQITKPTHLSKLHLCFARYFGHLVRDTDIEWPNFKNHPGTVYLAYFQDHNLVESVWPDLCERLSRDDAWNQVLMQPLKDRLTIHVRLGDYVSNSRATKFHGLTNPEYFIEIAEGYRKKYPNLPIHIVSDSIELAGNLLNKINALPGVTFEDDEGPMDALTLLATSSTVAISNSSFSWWGGWIGSKKGATVIAPRPWFAEEHLTTKLIPPGWIQKERKPVRNASRLMNEIQQSGR